MLLYVLVMGCWLSKFHVIVCISYGMLVDYIFMLLYVLVMGCLVVYIFMLLYVLVYGMLVDYISCYCMY